MGNAEVPLKDELLDLMSGQAEQIEKTLERYGTPSDKVCRGLIEGVAVFRRNFGDFIASDQNLTDQLAQLDANTLLAIEAMRKTDERQDEFQIRFDSNVRIIANTRIDAFKVAASYLEKISLLGIASFGLTVTLFSFLSAHATVQTPLRRIGFAIAAWCLIVASIGAATFGHSAFTKMSHTLLNTLADNLGVSALKESAQIYKQPEEDIKAKEGSAKSASRYQGWGPSPIHLQSSKLMRISDLATTLIVAGFFMFLLFIGANLRSLSAVTVAR